MERGLKQKFNVDLAERQLGEPFAPGEGGYRFDALARRDGGPADFVVLDDNNRRLRRLEAVTRKPLWELSFKAEACPPGQSAEFVVQDGLHFAVAGHGLGRWR